MEGVGGEFGLPSARSGDKRASNEFAPMSQLHVMNELMVSKNLAGDGQISPSTSRRPGPSYRRIPNRHHS